MVNKLTSCLLTFFLFKTIRKAYHSNEARVLWRQCLPTYLVMLLSILFWPKFEIKCTLNMETSIGKQKNYLNLKKKHKNMKKIVWQKKNRGFDWVFESPRFYPYFRRRALSHPQDLNQNLWLVIALHNR